MGIALIGWLWNKHGPEEAVPQKHIISWSHVFQPSVRKAFIMRASDGAYAQNSSSNGSRQGDRRKKSQYDERFFRLLEKADDIFLAIIHFSAETPDRETAEIEKALRQTGDALGHARVSSAFQIKENESEPSRKLFEEINEALSIASGRNDKQSDGEPSRLPASFYFLRNAFDWQSPF